MMFLQWTINDETSVKHLHTHETITIGRLANCDVSLQDKWVSRQHAEIFTRHVDTQRTFIRNLSARNWIYFHHPLHLQPLRYDEVAELREDYIFQIGKVMIQVMANQRHDGEEVICSTCGRHVVSHLYDCPWCGTNLAFAAELTTPANAVTRVGIATSVVPTKPRRRGAFQ